MAHAKKTKSYLAFLKYIFISILKDKMLWGMVFLNMAVTALSFFLGGTALIEEQQFSIIYTAGSLRFLNVLCSILIVCVFVRRVFDSREAFLWLSKGFSRAGFIWAYMICFSLILTLIPTLFLSIAGALVGIAPDNIWLNLYISSISAELTLMIAVAVWFAFSLSSASLATLLCLTFYAFARMSGMFLDIAGSGLADGALLYLVPVLEGILHAIPRLDLNAQSGWLLYGVTDLTAYAIQIFHQYVFALFVMAVAILDFGKRRF